MTAPPPLPPLHPPADLFNPSGRPLPGRERGALPPAPPAAEPALHPGSAATPIPSSGRPDHPRVSPSLGAPAKGTAGGSRRGAEVVTPAAPAATADPRDLGRLKGPLYILARDAPVTWDAATRRWWGAPPAGPIAGAALQMIDRALLERWDANPRRVPDEAKLDQLARSIAADGVLQNLVVRPHPKRKGHYQVITGNRRHAAHAIARSEYNPALPPELPCRVAHLSDLEAQRLATVENVQRADMHPMDEAEAFARMLELGDNIENVAALTGLSVGTVKKRVALAVQLAPVVKTAFREGRMNLAVAQAFTIGSKDEQAKLLKRNRDTLENAHWIRSQLADARVPVAYAIFDVAAFEAAGGRIVRDLFAGEHDTDAYFDDATAFRTAQGRAIKEKLAALKAAGWSWVEHKKGGYAHDYEYGWAKSKNKKLAGAVLHESERGEVKVFEGLVKPADKARAEKAKTTARGRAAGDDADTAEPVKLAGRALMVACHHRKTAALQLGVATAFEGPALRVPMACAVMALLSDGSRYGGSEIMIRAEAITGDNRLETSPLDAQMRDLLAPLVDQGLIDRALGELREETAEEEAAALDAEAAEEDLNDDELEARQAAKASNADMRKADLFRALMNYRDLPALFACLVARQVGSWAGHTPALGSTPLACAIAERVTPGVLALGPKGAPVWQPDEDWLKRYGRDGLGRVALALGIPAADARRLAGAKKAQAIADILKHPERDPEAIPPELRFLTPEETERDLRALDPAGAVAADAEPLKEAAE